MSDSGHTMTDRPPAYWTRQEHANRLRQYIAWATHPDVQKTSIMMDVATLKALADLLDDGSLQVSTPDV